MPFPDLQVQADSGLPFAWVEYVSRSGSTSGASFGPDGNNCTMQIIMRWEDLETGVPYLVGSSRRLAPNRVSRQLPFRHPRFYSLYCNRIVSVKGIRFRRKNNGFGFGPLAETTYVLLTLQFTRPKYSLLTDIETVNEYDRYLDRQWTPSVQMLTREGVFFQYLQGRPAGRRVASSPGVRLVKLKISRTWHLLPYASVFDEDGFPTQVVINPEGFTDNGIGDTPSPLGCVNGTEIFGAEPETLLYSGLQIMPVNYQMPPDLINVLFFETEPFLVNITFHFEYFRPPRGVDEAHGDTFPVSRVGHNCAPWAGDQRWYPIGTTGGVGGVGINAPPFPLFEFRRLFKTR